MIVLYHGFHGSGITGLLDGPFPASFPAETNEGGYESDSDIEDNEDEPVQADVGVLTEQFAETEFMEAVLEQVSSLRR